MTAETWTQDQAIDLCRQIEEVCQTHGCHVALTGGTLYKRGPRKDADVLFCRIRQVDEIDKDGLFMALRDLGFLDITGFGWCHKAIFNGKRVDLFFPEEDGDHYCHTADAVLEEEIAF